MDIGRNDPCPCGSGKKYKRCCGAPKTDPLAEAAARVRAIQDRLEPRIERFASECFGEDFYDLAWADFVLDAEGLQPGRDELQAFHPWTLYSWAPADRRQSRRSRDVPDMPLAERFKVEHEVTLTTEEHEVLGRISDTPFSFHEVLDVEPGRSLRTRDVMTETTTTVFERNASSMLRVGDLFYGRVVDFSDVALIIGSGSLPFPPDAKGPLIDLRKAIRKDFRTVDAIAVLICDEALRDVYFALREQRLNPTMPQLHNTDGDPMEFHTLSYKLADAESTIAALAPLTEESAQELLAELTRPRPGNVRRVGFAWTRPGNAMHGGMPNTVLAGFKVDGNTLTVDVNSAKRAKRVRAEIAKRLGDRATFLGGEKKSLQDALGESNSKPESRRERSNRLRDEELQARPEVQAAIAKMTADHYDTWPDVPLPALKGKTPRAAMRSKDGRERVEALITDFERSQDRGKTKAPHYDFNQLRAALGLPLRKT